MCVCESLFIWMCVNLCSYLLDQEKSDLNNRASESYRQREIKVRDYTLLRDRIPTCMFSLISPIALSCCLPLSLIWAAVRVCFSCVHNCMWCCACVFAFVKRAKTVSWWTFSCYMTMSVKLPSQLTHTHTHTQTHAHKQTNTRVYVFWCCMICRTPTRLKTQTKCCVIQLISAKIWHLTQDVNINLHLDRHTHTHAVQTQD